jgi:hypothetical protein
MPLADLQAALARLYRDRALRRQFSQNPAVAAEMLGLSAAETAQLRAEFDQIERYAESLVRKRFAEVAQLLPRTIAALAADAFTRFRAFHDACPLTDARTEPGRFAEHVAYAERDTKSWLSDTARLEAALLQSRRRLLVVRTFRHPVLHLLNPPSGAASRTCQRNLLFLITLANRPYRLRLPLSRRRTRPAHC